jgi:hypothetical protein
MMMISTRIAPVLLVWTGVVVLSTTTASANRHWTFVQHGSVRPLTDHSNPLLLQWSTQDWERSVSLLGSVPRGGALEADTDDEEKEEDDDEEYDDTEDESEEESEESDEEEEDDDVEVAVVKESAKEKEKALTLKKSVKSKLKVKETKPYDEPLVQSNMLNMYTTIGIMLLGRKIDLLSPPVVKFAR